MTVKSSKLLFFVLVFFVPIFLCCNLLVIICFVFISAHSYSLIYIPFLRTRIARNFFVTLYLDYCHMNVTC